MIEPPSHQIEHCAFTRARGRHRHMAPFAGDRQPSRPMREEPADAEPGTGSDDPERRSGDALAVTDGGAVGRLQMGQGKRIRGEIVDDEQPVEREM